MKLAIGGIIIGLILLLINPLIAVIVIAAAIAVPVAAYFMLDPSQRRRLKRIQERKQLGR
jgi:Flp pilus assembly protein TadB